MQSRIERLYPYVLIGLVSCSLLMYEVLLTRICALRVAFHFGYLVISNCLLAVGASGTFLALAQDRLRQAPRVWVWRLALLYVVSVVVTYAFLLTFPVDSPEAGLLDFSQPASLVRFVVFNFAAAVPFFFGGAVVGLLLSFDVERVNRLYFVDLIGAAAGCLLSPLALTLFGAGGCVLVLALLGLAGAVAATPPERRRTALPAAAAAAALGLALVPSLDERFPVPGRGILSLTRDHKIDTSRRPEFTQWTATSRIDLVAGGKKGGVIFSRGEKTAGQPPVPDQKIIVQDANAGTMIVNFSDHPEALEILRRSMYSAAVRLRPNARVLVIGVGGGNDVWAALAAGARSVRGIELNAPILAIHREVFPDYTRALVGDPRVELVVDEGRSALSRDKGLYDVIQLTGVDTWTGLKSGAYVLAENYLYTQEAIEAMLARLAPGGILQITRMAAEMEALRMAANLDAAVRATGGTSLHRSLMAMHTGDVLMAFLLKKGAYTRAEVDQTLAYLLENGIYPVVLPHSRTGMAVEKFVREGDKAAFIDAYPRDISPTTDDRPYFFNFTRWTDPLRARSLANEPPHVSQGNPFFVLAQLGLAAALSVLLIAVPLVRLGPRLRAGAGRFLIYFGGVGLGFIMLEIGMIQKLTVFLGHPVHSITVTLASVLLFAGIGSLVSEQWFRGAPERVWVIAIGIAALVGGFLSVWPALFAAAVGFPLAARIAIAVALLAPLSLLLGVPFAYGIRRLRERNPSAVPWAWAVNGCMSVVGSIFSVVVSMMFGFSVTLALAVGVYALAFAALPRAR